jgi:hypothetical protein
VAQSQGDILGLILTAYSDVATISVEVDPRIGDGDLGHSALIFRDMLLLLPEFDDLPAWANFSEGRIPQFSGIVEMWRDGASLSSLFSGAWNSFVRRSMIRWKSLRGR